MMTPTTLSTDSLHDSLDTVATEITDLNSILKTAPISQDSFTAIDTDTTFLTSQVGEVKILIQQLFKYRATLLRSLNYRESRICKLPPEALGEIFKYVCYPSTKTSMRPTKVGAICSHWRQVAWSVPQLWTDLIIGNRFWKSSQRTKVLDLYYKNMGGLLFNVTILTAPDEGPKGEGGILFQDVFDRLFVRHAHKLRTLMFEESPTSWLPHLEKASDSGGGFPNLESLEISDNSCENPLLILALLFFKKNPPIVFHNVPKLRRLVLQDVTSTVDFPWAQLTELSLNNVNSETALDIVLQCQNLVTLKLEDLSRTSSDVDVTLPSEPLVLQNLETLEYKSSHISVHWEEALVQCLRLSDSLKKLAWLTKEGTPELRKEFLLRLPTSITELRLDCNKERDNIRSLEEVLARMTSLRNITLHLQDPLDLEVVKLFTIIEGVCFLPTLRSISLVLMRSEYNCQEMSDILDMVRSRWVMQEGKDPFEGFTFGFPFVEQKEMGWTREFKAELDKIVHKEMHVQVSGRQARQLGVWLQN